MAIRLRNAVHLLFAISSFLSPAAEHPCPTLSLVQGHVESGDVDSAFELSHAQFVHQEARRRIQNAWTKFCPQTPLRESGSGNNESCSEKMLMSDQTRSFDKGSRSIRIWSREQLERVRKSTNQVLDKAEGNLQGLVDCLHNSCPAHVVIGAFLSSCQV